VLDETGTEITLDEPSWAETDLVQAIAHRPNARAWYALDEAALGERVRGRAVADIVEEARRVGGTVATPSELPFKLPSRYRLAVHVRAAITHTIGGLRIDERARVLRKDGSPIDGLYAAGVDAGGIATHGYASGLAQALVLGLTAAEDAARAT
jgi:predicted oxidoreductase